MVNISYNNRGEAMKTKINNYHLQPQGKFRLKWMDTHECPMCYKGVYIHEEDGKIVSAACSSLGCSWTFGFGIKKEKP